MSVTTKIPDGYAIVIPTEIRQSLDLVPGDKLQGEIKEGVIIIRPQKKVTLEGICGMTSSGGDAVTDKKRVQSDEG
ncbi:MAG: AbrB/MazE/SpoVT family DNA-binding domain-containing protein [Methanoregula sp.]